MGLGRYALCVSLLVLLIPATLAFSLQIDQELSTQAGQPLIISYEAEPGTIITDIGLTSNDEALQAMMNAHLADTTIDALSAKDSTEVLVPADAPSVASDVTINIAYRTPNYERVVHEQSTHLIIEGEKENDIPWYASVLPDDAMVVLMSIFANYTIPRLSTDLTHKDLTPTQVTALGMSPSEYGSLLAQLAEAKTNDDDTQMNAIYAQLPSFTRISRNSQDVLSAPNDYEADGSQPAQIEMLTSLYNVTYNDKSIVVSKVVLSASADSFLGDGEFILEIPKELAQDVDQASFVGFYEVVERDPVVKWALKNVPQDQVQDYSFTTSGDVQNFEILADAAADKPGWIAQLLLWLFGK